MKRKLKEMEEEAARLRESQVRRARVFGRRAGARRRRRAAKQQHPLLIPLSHTHTRTFIIDR